MEIGLRFTGYALNVVDTKGRVSLPAPFRVTIERRLNKATIAGDGPLPRAVMIGQHERYPALQAFDLGYLDTLHAQLERRVAQMADVDAMAAFDDAQLDAFGSFGEVGFDPAGRMVLSQQLRNKAGIADLAYFIAAGDTFQIWHPDRFRAHHADKPRALQNLDEALAERAAKATAKGAEGEG